MLDCAGMKKNITAFILALLVIAAGLSSGFCFAEESVSSRLEKNEGIKTIILEAPSIVGTESFYNAEGPVLMHSGNKRITASSLTFDAITGKAIIKNAVITSCTQTPAHFSIEARKLSLSKTGWAEADKLSIRLGRTKIFYIPWIKLHFSEQGGGQTMFPMVWYDSTDGISISKSILLYETKRIESAVNAKITTKNGTQGLASVVYGIDGELAPLPGRDLGDTYWAPGAISEFRSVMETYPTGYPDSLGKYASKLRLYTNYAVKQRIDDIGNNAITVFKRPEVGVHYIGQPLDRFVKTHDPRLTLSPAVDLSWSRMREDPSDLGSVERVKLSVSAAFNLFDMGKNTAIQPIVNQVWYKYRNIRDYQILTYGLDASHVYNDGSHANLRYLNRTGRGTAIFESDDIDVHQEIQAATTIMRGNRRLSLMSAYDFQKHNLYDWEFGYGYATDCLDVGAYYNRRLQRIGAKLVLKNL